VFLSYDKVSIIGANLTFSEPTNTLKSNKIVLHNYNIFSLVNVLRYT